MGLIGCHGQDRVHEQKRAVAESDFAGGMNGIDWWLLTGLHKQLRAIAEFV